MSLRLILGLATLALRFLLHVSCEGVISRLNEYLESYRDCKIMIFFDPTIVNIEPTTVPIFLNSVPRQATEIMNFLEKFSSVGYDATSDKIQSDGRLGLRKCFVYFTVLYNVSIEGYLCPEGFDGDYLDDFERDDLYTRHYLNNVELVVIGKELAIGGSIRKRADCINSLTFIRVEAQCRAGNTLPNYIHFYTKEITIVQFGGNWYFPFEYWYSSCTAIDIRQCSPTPQSGIKILDLEHTWTYFPCEQEINRTKVTGTELLLAFGPPFKMKRRVEQFRQASRMSRFKRIFTNYLNYILQQASPKVCYCATGIDQSAVDPELFFSFFTKNDEDFSALERSTMEMARDSSWRRDEIGIVLTGSAEMRFVTCNGVTEKTSFIIYVLPYDWLSWICILLCPTVALPASIVLVSLFQRCPNGRRLKFLLNFYLRAMVSCLSFLVDVSTSISDSVFQSMGSLYKYRLIFGAWLMALVVIVNAYKGLVTSYLLAPLGPLDKWTNYNQLDGFRPFVGIHYSSQLLMDVRPPPIEKLHFRILCCQCILEFNNTYSIICDLYTKVSVDAGEDVEYHCKSILDINVNKKYRDKPPTQETCRNITLILLDVTWTLLMNRPLGKNHPQDFLPMIKRVLPKYQYIPFNELKDAYNLRPIIEYFPDLEECEKTVMVEDETKLRNLVIASQYKNIKYGKNPPHYSMGHESFFKSNLGLLFRSIEKNNIHYKTMQVMLQSGIHQLWMRWAGFVSEDPSPADILRMKEAVTYYRALPKKLIINGNIRTLLIAFSTLTSAVGICFLIELLIFDPKRLLRIVSLLINTSTAYTKKLFKICFYCDRRRICVRITHILDNIRNRQIIRLNLR